MDPEIYKDIIHKTVSLKTIFCTQPIKCLCSILWETTYSKTKKGEMIGEQWQSSV